MTIRSQHSESRNKPLGKLLSIFGIFLLSTATLNASCSYAVTNQSQGLNQNIKTRKNQKKPAMTQRATQSLQLKKFQNAASFVDSIGAYVSASFVTPADKTKLQELGIRHIRVELRPTEIDTLNKVKELTQLGLKLTMIMDPRNLTTADEAVPLANKFAGSVAAIEGPNELDIYPFQYKGASFPNGLRMFHQELYQAVKRDPNTAQLPLLSPSIAGIDNVSVLGRVDCDINNLHYYPKEGSIPAVPFFDNIAIPKIKALCGDSKPIVITEAGYHNATNYSSTEFWPGIPESISAKYSSRLLLEYFNRDVSRTFIFKLRDDAQNLQKNDRELNFGLLKYDGTPKPAFNTIKNMVSILNTPAVKAQLKSRSRQSFKTKKTAKPRQFMSVRNTLPVVSLQGDLSNLHHTLLQESGNSYYLILWQEVESYSASSRQAISVPARSIKVISNTPLKAATLYNPLKSANPISRVTQRRELSVSVPDHPLIFKLVFN
jgi:hypothetical protein